jgi:hypothetical protein
VTLVVETGAGVEGANALAHPAFAAEYHADRGNLVEAGVYPVSAAVFAAAASTVSVPSNGANVPSGSVVLFEGATEPGNSGYCIVTAVASDLLTVAWMDDLADETADVTMTVFEQEGWWDSRRRLEASLVNATEYIAVRSWYGTPVSDVQGTPFPRQQMMVRRTGQYYAAGHLIPEDEVPLAVKHAVCHLSLEDLAEALSEVRRPSQQLKSKRIGPISKSFDNPRGTRRFPTVDRMLLGLVAPRRPFVRIAR